MLTRRRLLALGLGGACGAAAAGAIGVDLVSRGILPGRAVLDELTGGCSVPQPQLAYAPLGPSF